MNENNEQPPVSEERPSSTIPTSSTIARRGFLAAAAGGAALFFGLANRESKPVETAPQVAATEPAPAPLATPEASPTTEQPTTEEKIELKGEGDWDKYFTAVSATEAEELFKSQQEGFIFPFDPRPSTNLVVETTGKTVEGKEEKVLSISNVAQDTVIYSPFKGMVTHNDPAQNNNTLNLAVSGYNPDRPRIYKGQAPFPSSQVFTLSASEAMPLSQLPYEEVDIGSKVATLHSNSSDKTSATVQFKRPDYFDYGKPPTSFNFIKREGKIAFIESTPTTSGN